MKARWARIVLLFLVGMNLTVICQGHDVGDAHSSLHIAFFTKDEHSGVSESTQATPAHDDSHAEAGEHPADPADPAAEHTGASPVQFMAPPFPAPPSAPESAPRTCSIGPSSGGSGGTGLFLLSVAFSGLDLAADKAPARPRLTYTVSLAAQTTAHPEDPPPRFAQL